MSESKHTPGPRTIRERPLHPGPGICIEVFGQGGVCVATMIYRGDDAEGIEATRTDAQLDAAAPEMLEALLQHPVRLPGEPLPEFMHRLESWASEFLDPAIHKATRKD